MKFCMRKGAESHIHEIKHQIKECVRDGSARYMTEATTREFSFDVNVCTTASSGLPMLGDAIIQEKLFVSFT